MCVNFLWNNEKYFLAIKEKEMIRIWIRRQGELRMEHKYLKIKVKAREVGRRIKIRHHRGIIGDIARSIARKVLRCIADRSSSHRRNRSLLQRLWKYLIRAFVKTRLPRWINTACFVSATILDSHVYPDILSRFHASLEKAC